MPPEYINNGDVSRKFDVFSLGVVIIRIMDGNDGNSRRFHMPREQFIEFVRNRDIFFILLYYVLCCVLLLYICMHPIFLILSANFSGS
jgi:hypothetical protein